MNIEHHNHHACFAHIENACAADADDSISKNRTKRHRRNRSIDGCNDQKTIVHCHPCRSDDDHCPPRNNPKKTVWDYVIQILIILLIVFLISIALVFTWRNGWLIGISQSKPITEEVFVADPTPEGGPCRRWSDGVCKEAKDTQSAIKWSRYYLRRGDAESALQDWSRARRHYRAAIDIGSGVGAQSAIYAAKRIQFQSMTCEFTPESLARISRDYDKNPLGALIEMKQKQQALKGLGYYVGKIDNKHGAETRAAIRKFQDDLWFDQKGVLTAEQTVLLVCGAAHIAKDIGSQNVLGIMYAGGLGVSQSTDFALDWLEAAAQRGDADASWNLAMLYGTRTVLSSVQVCDAVQNAERADSYLREAVAARHPAAKRAWAKYPHDTPELRWRKLSGDLNKPEALDRVGRGCNPNN